MSGGREYVVELAVECRVETCDTKDRAAVVSVGAEDARQGVLMVLRHRGWTIDRRDDLCPAHSGPIPACEVCGQPTPRPYSATFHRHLTGVNYACRDCARRAVSARFIQERES